MVLGLTQLQVESLPSTKSEKVSKSSSQLLSTKKVKSAEELEKTVKATHDQSTDLAWWCG